MLVSKLCGLIDRYAKVTVNEFPSGFLNNFWTSHAVLFFFLYIYHYCTLAVPSPQAQQCFAAVVIMGDSEGDK